MGVMFSDKEKFKEVIDQSRLPKLLEKVKAAFPDKDTEAHCWAKYALIELAR